MINIAYKSRMSRNDLQRTIVRNLADLEPGLELPVYINPNGNPGTYSVIARKLDGSSVMYHADARGNLTKKA